MSPHLDRATIERIVAKTRAPSGDNCQPWRFAWNAPILSVFHDDARARHRLSNAGAASLLALGCLLESLAIAASDEGAVARVHLEHLGDASGKPWASVAFERGDAPRDPLVDALHLRATDRRSYRGGPLPPDVARALAADDAPGARLHWRASPLADDLVDYVARSERFLVEDEHAMGDVLGWIRFTPEEILATRDGMPAAGLGARGIEVTSLRVLRRHPRLLPWFRAMGVAAQQMRLARERLRSSAGVFCVTSRGAAPEHLVAAGARAIRAWLALNAAGFGVQPLSQCSILLYNHRTGTLPEDTSPKWREHFREGDAVVRSAFSLSEHEVPVWIFRTGRSEPLPDAQRTLRLDVNQVLA